MIIRAFLIVFLFSSNVFAVPSESSLNNCEHEGRSYGDGSGTDRISPRCFDYYQSVAASEAIKVDGDLSIIGYRNIIFFKEKNKKMHMISGSSTELQEVIALSLDKKNNEIAVLDKSGDILFFSMTITGNVAPYRIIRHAELFGATSIIVNSAQDEVIVLNKDSSRVLFFNRLANVNGRKGKKNLEIKKTIEGLFNSPISFSYDQETNQLSIENKDGSKLQYLIEENGSISSS